jgi:DNA repair protein SbcD/Mre11
LFDEVLTRLVLEAKTKVILIAGNHDSGTRLQFGSRLLQASGVTVAGRLSEALQPQRFQDAHGPIDLYAIPYVEPAEVREWLGDESIRGHESAWQAVMARLSEGFAKEESGLRRILVAHAFVAGGLETESERPLSMGGSSVVPAEVFQGFDYVALGHLHRAQKVGSSENQALWYSGSLYKYAFSEVGHQKGALWVELSEPGKILVEPLPFTTQRDVRRVEGKLAELVSAGAKDSSPNDYIEAHLLDEIPQLHAMERLRDVYPNTLHIQRPLLQRDADGPLGLRGDHRKMGDLDLFREFMAQVFQREMSSAEEAGFLAAVAEVDGKMNAGSPAAIDAAGAT